MVRARGKLERREGTINVVVTEIAELERQPRPRGTGPGDERAALAEPTRRGREHFAQPIPALTHPPEHEPPAGQPRRRERELVVAELRAVAPAGHSFGRRGH